MPVFLRVCIWKGVALDGGVPENIEVVDFAEQVLNFLEVIAPGCVLFGKEIFDDVAKALDADAQGVQCYLRAVAQGAVVESAGFGAAFEGEVLEQRASRAETGSTPGERRARSAPFLRSE